MCPIIYAVLVPSQAGLWKSHAAYIPQLTPTHFTHDDTFITCYIKRAFPCITLFTSQSSLGHTKHCTMGWSLWRVVATWYPDTRCKLCLPHSFIMLCPAFQCRYPFVGDDIHLIALHILVQERTYFGGFVVEWDFGKDPVGRVRDNLYGKEVGGFCQRD